MNGTKKHQDLYTVNDIILGTNTSNQDQNYLIIAKVRVPCQTAIQKKYKESRSLITQANPISAKPLRRTKMLWSRRYRFCIRSRMMDKLTVLSTILTNEIIQPPELQQGKFTFSTLTISRRRKSILRSSFSVTIHRATRFSGICIKLVTLLRVVTMENYPFGI